MSSALPAFALELCHDPHLCNTFTLRIMRTDKDLCTEIEDPARRLSEEDVLDRWIKEIVGPDAFEIRTDGAERVGSTEAIYEGECQYRFDVQLRNAGPVYLSGWHSYEVRRILLVSHSE
jgi:hypothetical protein